jgi:aminopeptidase N
MTLDSFLQTQSKDYALIAYSLQVPDEVTLANEMISAQGFVDIDSLYLARNQLRQQLATALETDLKDVYNYLSNLPDAKGAYQFTPAEVSRRSLRNTCLDYLSTLAAEGSEASKKQEILSLLKNQFDTANCMTDKIAALKALSSLPSSERNDALATFYRDAEGNALVINKWFSIQALGDYSTILDDLKKLKTHPDFTLSNPNRARSLLSIFSNGNLYHFHQISGAGYEFLVDNILEVDAMNPQVASRLISSSFAMWKQFDPVRKGLMKAQLQRIQAASKLSPDSFEIVNRYLQE